MPSGERSQVWYPSVVALLRSQWRTDMTWEGAIELRALLQRELDDHQRQRGIARAHRFSVAFSHDAARTAPDVAHSGK